MTIVAELPRVELCAASTHHPAAIDDRARAVQFDDQGKQDEQRTDEHERRPGQAVSMTVLNIPSAA